MKDGIVSVEGGERLYQITAAQGPKGPNPPDIGDGQFWFAIDDGTKFVPWQHVQRVARDHGAGPLRVHLRAGGEFFYKGLLLCEPKTTPSLAGLCLKVTHLHYLEHVRATRKSVVGRTYISNKPMPVRDMLLEGELLSPMATKAAFLEREREVDQHLAEQLRKDARKYAERQHARVAYLQSGPVGSRVSCREPLFGGQVLTCYEASLFPELRRPEEGVRTTSGELYEYGWQLIQSRASILIPPPAAVLIFEKKL